MVDAGGLDPILVERYELEAAIGEGGFGIVYRARQRATGQAVAIKVIKSARNMGRRLARFARETQLCAELHHPHIVRLIDAHQTEHSGWSAFELAPGCDLAAVLAGEGRLEPAEAVRLMAQVLDGLAAAHAKGIVHRDLKPANIMVVPTGARRNALILDFGVGALIEERQTVDLTRLTATAEPVGTPAYAAPEQLRGLPTTVRSDLYAWALTFVECLTGERAITGRNLAEVLVKQVGADPVELPLELSGHPLGRLLGRALVKEPVDRAVSAAELLGELETIDVAALAAAFAGRPTPRRALAAAPTQTHVTGTLPPGGPHETEATLPTSVAPIAAPAAEEHSPVSLLSCVLRPTVAGPETDAALRAEVAAIAEVARRFGGRIGSVFGDTVSVVFGLPRVGEDDPARAARTGLAIAAESAERVAIRLEGGRPAVGVAAALHCGALVLQADAADGLRPGWLVGHAARVAADLARRGTPGTVRASAGARARLARRFVLEDHGDRATLAGEPAPVFALVGERSDRAWTVGAMVGRDDELARVVACWRCVVTGEGRAVLLRGEAGIGKSRLVAAFAEHAVDTPHRWLDVRCTADGVHAALRPIVGLLERLVGRGEPDGPDALDAFAERLGLDPAAIGPLLGPLVGLPFSGPAPDVSPGKRRAMTLAVVVDVLRRMAAADPVVLVVEDLHWADATTMAFLEHLVAGLEDIPLMLLATTRPSGRCPEGTVQIVDVPRLDRAGVAALADRVAGRPLHDDVLDRLFERSDGVPLFVEEVVRSIAEAGEPSGSASTQTPASTPAFTIPSSLEALLVARLDRLGEARATARIAAVIGRTVDQDLLELIDPRGGFAARDALSRIAERGLMQRTWRLNGTRWTFRHALVRDAAYGSMPDETRRAVHGRVADALIEHFAARAEARPDVVARHLAGAGRVEEAVAWSLRASGGALMRSANAEAIGHADEALGWLADIESDAARSQAELELNGLICPALMATSGWTDPRIKQVAERSLTLLDAVADGPHLQRTIWTLMTYAHMGGRDRATALRLARRLLTLADDDGARVAAHCAVANCLWIDGDYPGARHHFERVMADYVPERDRHHALIYGQDTRVWAGNTYAGLLYLCGHRSRARALSEELLDSARSLKHAGTEALALLFTIGQCHYDSDHAGARHLRDALMRLAERHDLPAHGAYAGVLGAWADGDPATGEQCALGPTRIGCELGMTYYFAVVAQTELEAGRVAKARARCIDVFAQAVAMPEPYYLGPLHTLAARAAIAGNAPRAEVTAHLVEARRWAVDRGAAMVRLDAALIGAAWDPGDAQVRAELVEALEGCPDPGPARITRAQSRLAASSITPGR